ncbi:PaaI family thioesterase [Pelomonas sp. KK5]|uniref:PaaI family thioesterase n=1 Tax=Pelomonas sp. KK5 TaxID=1855730 RepID=UPI00097C627E|nr:PaaI family thioesterase [Pelomonas sp. KK5]
MTLKFPVHIPFVERLGFELVSVGQGEAELALDLAEAHLNSWNVAHGGVVMTLLDVAMAHAARSVNRKIHEDGTPDFGPGVVTVEMKTSFMRPGEGRLRATGRLLHRSTTMAFTEGSVLDEHGKLCAHATGTFKYLRALPGRGHAIKPLNGKPGE